MIPLWIKYQLEGWTNPLTLALLALVVILSLYRWRPVAARRLGWGTVFLLWMVSTSQMADIVALPLENRYPPVPVADLPSSDVIIILGGAIRGPSPPRLEVELTEASDRVLHGFRLFQAKKASKILISGGGQPVPEAEFMARLLLLWGVPSTAILQERESLSTRENGLESQKIVSRLGMKKILLVTSALHMPRAMGVFQALKMDVTPATTDIVAPFAPRNSRYGFNLFPGMLPSPNALAYTTTASHEWAALWLYSYRGWL
ncbi:MAG: YdcF family protein [Magnetococcales bacterium]|nr:YdcF family protein [Magnetococcales bacterium]